jgi:hypothetical protein
MTINNGKDGEMLWRFKTMNDNISISTDDIVESMMRKVSRNSLFEISYRFYEIIPSSNSS